jgi:hypothetical protein
MTPTDRTRRLWAAKVPSNKRMHPTATWATRRAAARWARC